MPQPRHCRHGLQPDRRRALPHVYLRSWVGAEYEGEEPMGRKFLVVGEPDYDGIDPQKARTNL